MDDIHMCFRRGAEELARGQAYGSVHRSHGLLEADWDLLTQDEPWTPEQARRCRSVIASVCEVSLTIAGMPPVPLPGHYVAAVIAICVGPANRLVACHKVPETFDAVAATGIHSQFEVRPMRPEQMMSLVLAYSGGMGAEPPMHRLKGDVVEIVKKEIAK